MNQETLSVMRFGQPDPFSHRQGSEELAIKRYDFSLLIYPNRSLVNIEPIAVIHSRRLLAEAYEVNSEAGGPMAFNPSPKCSRDQSIGGELEAVEGATKISGMN